MPAQNLLSFQNAMVYGSWSNTPPPALDPTGLKRASTLLFSRIFLSEPWHVRLRHQLNFLS